MQVDTLRAKLQTHIRHPAISVVDLPRGGRGDVHQWEMTTEEKRKDP